MKRTSGAHVAIAAATLCAATASATSSAPFAAVYTMTNDAAANEIVVFSRSANGALMATAVIPTGGAGTGEGLGSQGALVLSGNGRWLLAVNAGSDDISVFSVTPMGLVLTDVEPSLGDMPTSIAIHGRLVYILNAAGAGGIQGFQLDNRGDLSPIARSDRPLSGAAMTMPAQVGFSPDGSTLVVTERATNLIDTYTVLGDGTTMGPLTTPSAGETPFGFDFTQNGRLLVSEAFGGAPDASAASSYDLIGGVPAVISASVPTTETAACWLVVTDSNRFAYTTNTGSACVSGYAIDPATGVLSLLDADGVTGETGDGPLDAAFSAGSRYLYTLDSGSDSISVFRVNPASGALTLVQTVEGLPATALGIAAN
jgi:6-phosphogluconolactonase